MIAHGYRISSRNAGGTRSIGSVAYAKIIKEGCSAFTIRDGGIVVMYHSQIEEHCRAAKAALLQGRMPAPH